MNTDRFKFRVWNKTENKYDSGYFLLNHNGILLYSAICDDGGYPMMSEADTIIEQCTGLRDKNGTLIYDGDILSIDMLGLGERFVVIESHRYNLMIRFPDGAHGSIHYLETCKGWNTHVVGNIHENVELLLPEKKRLILQGIAEGKITPATQKWWESLSNEDLKNYLPTAPVIVNTNGDSK